eukprot:9499750-Pyramimonas_sp.AAC.1
MPFTTPWNLASWAFTAGCMEICMRVDRGCGEGVRGGSRGRNRSSVASLVSLRTRLKVKITRGIFKVCRTVHEGHKRPKRWSYHRCEHPGLPGASSVCNVLVPWTNPSPVRRTDVQCGTAKGPLGFHSSNPITVKAR